jgi:hypothetical protein
VIQLNADLNSDERNLLSVAYTNIVGSRRDDRHEEGRGNSARVEELQAYKEMILS